MIISSVERISLKINDIGYYFWSEVMLVINIVVTIYLQRITLRNKTIVVKRVVGIYVDIFQCILT
jgi:hypothetical protein